MPTFRTHPVAFRNAVAALVVALYNAINTAFIAFSLSTLAVSLLLLLLFCTVRSARTFIIAVLPMIAFVVIYDLMRIYPNYLVATPDTAGLFHAEQRLFGITAADGRVLAPCEYFRDHHCAVLDLVCGVCYLLWVPLPMFYALWLYVTHRRRQCLRFLTAFLLVNLVGFAGYYIHPAAPPWYVMQHGFDVHTGTPGNVAGFGRFDALVHLPVFHGLYAKNANVFAAVPSLHAAYNPVALYYALRFGRLNRDRLWVAATAVVSVGIWFAAVYSGHHYIIDVLLGILTVVLTLSLFEGVLMRTPLARRIARHLTLD